MFQDTDQAFIKALVLLPQLQVRTGAGGAKVGRLGGLAFPPAAPCALFVVTPGPEVSFL